MSLALFLSLMLHLLMLVFTCHLTYLSHDSTEKQISGNREKRPPKLPSFTGCGHDYLFCSFPHSLTVLLTACLTRTSHTKCVLFYQTFLLINFFQDFSLNSFITLNHHRKRHKWTLQEIISISSKSRHEEKMK